MKTILLLEDDESFNCNEIDLIISDVGLEDGSGFDFCEEIRKKSNVVIIFLTALDQEVDIVTGYDLGADDYITKPFSLMVLISKVNALMRRMEKTSISDSIVCGNITFILDEMKVLKNDIEVIVSKNELKLLKYLIINPKQILSKDQLLKALWDIDGQFVDENTVAVNIRRLREKIEDNPSKPEYIKMLEV